MIEKFLSSRITHYALLIAFLSFGQMVFVLPEGADTYFVMNLGRYILEQGFPHVDPFTIHENLQLVAQQWLSGVIFWEAYKNFGVDGLRLVDIILGTASVLIYWRLCLFVSGGNKILSFALSLIVCLVVTPVIVPRPQIFSAVFFLIEVFLLEKFTRTQDARFLLPLPLISVALINFHAAVWVMSLVLCLPFLFVKNSRHIKFLLAAMAGIFFFGLINPYGIEAMTYVLHSYGVKIINSNVREMFTPTAHTLEGKIFYLTEALLIFSLTKFKAPWRYIFLSGGITFMALMHERNLILFYFLATIPAAYVWRDFSLEKLRENRKALTILFFLFVAANTVMVTTLLQDSLEGVPAPLKILFFATMLFMLYNLLILKVDGRIFHPQILPKKISSLTFTLIIVSGIFFATLINTRTEPPQPYTDAIKFLLRTERPENISLYVEQNIGGLAGMFDIKYYIDSRSEVFLPANNNRKNILAEYLDFTTGKLYYKDFFARYDFTHIILTNSKPFTYNQLSDDKNFRVIYESERVEGYEVIRCKIFRKD